MRDPISRFRSLLETTVESARQVDTKASRISAATAQALLEDFNNLFPARIYSSDNLNQLIDKHCHKYSHQCPICGKQVIKRTGKYGDYLACTDSMCGGARSFKTGKPTQNLALKNFIASQEYKHKMSRFSNLE